MEITNKLVIAGLAGLVVFVWQLLEIIMYGEISDRKVDNIIALLFTCSLYYNYKYCMSKKKEEEGEHNESN